MSGTRAECRMDPGLNDLARQLHFTDGYGVLSARRAGPNELDRIMHLVPYPKDVDVKNPLPEWTRLPLCSKIPFVKSPKDYTVYKRGKLGQTVRRQGDIFDLSDPFNYSLRMDYEAIHDKHLRHYFFTPGNKKIIEDMGMLTKDDEVKCDLKEYNAYRRYVYNVHKNSVLNALRAAEEAEHDKAQARFFLKDALETQRKQLDKEKVEKDVIRREAQRRVFGVCEKLLCEGRLARFKRIQEKKAKQKERNAIRLLVSKRNFAEELQNYKRKSHDIAWKRNIRAQSKWKKFVESEATRKQLKSQTEHIARSLKVIEHWINKEIQQMTNRQRDKQIYEAYKNFSDQRRKARDKSFNLIHENNLKRLEEIKKFGPTPQIEIQRKQCYNQVGEILAGRKFLKPTTKPVKFEKPKMQEVMRKALEDGEPLAKKYWGINIMSSRFTTEISNSILDCIYRRFIMMYVRYAIFRYFPIVITEVKHIIAALSEDMSRKDCSVDELRRFARSFVGHRHGTIFGPAEPFTSYGYVGPLKDTIYKRHKNKICPCNMNNEEASDDAQHKVKISPIPTSMLKPEHIVSPVNKKGVSTIKKSENVKKLRERYKTPPKEEDETVVLTSILKKCPFRVSKEGGDTCCSVAQSEVCRCNDHICDCDEGPRHVTFAVTTQPSENILQKRDEDELRTSKVYFKDKPNIFHYSIDNAFDADRSKLEATEREAMKRIGIEPQESSITRSSSEVRVILKYSNNTPPVESKETFTIAKDDDSQKVSILQMKTVTISQFEVPSIPNETESCLGASTERICEETHMFAETKGITHKYDNYFKSLPSSTTISTSSSATSDEAFSSNELELNNPSARGFNELDGKNNLNQNIESSESDRLKCDGPKANGNKRKPESHKTSVVKKKSKKMSSEEKLRHSVYADLETNPEPQISPEEKIKKSSEDLRPRGVNLRNRQGEDKENILKKQKEIVGLSMNKTLEGQEIHSKNINSLKQVFDPEYEPVYYPDYVNIKEREQPLKSILKKSEFSPVETSSLIPKYMKLYKFKSTSALQDFVINQWALKPGEALASSKINDASGPCTRHKDVENVPSQLKKYRHEIIPEGVENYKTFISSAQNKFSTKHVWHCREQLSALPAELLKDEFYKNLIGLESSSPKEIFAAKTEKSNTLTKACMEAAPELNDVFQAFFNRNELQHADTEQKLHRPTIKNEKRNQEKKGVTRKRFNSPEDVIASSLILASEHMGPKREDFVHTHKSKPSDIQTVAAKKLLDQMKSLPQTKLKETEPVTALSESVMSMQASVSSTGSSELSVPEYRKFSFLCNHKLNPQRATVCRMCGFCTYNKETESADEPKELDLIRCRHCGACIHQLFSNDSQALTKDKDESHKTQKMSLDKIQKKSSVNNEDDLDGGIYYLNDSELALYFSKRIKNKLKSYPDLRGVFGEQSDPNKFIYFVDRNKDYICISDVLRKRYPARAFPWNTERQERLLRRKLPISEVKNYKSSTDIFVKKASKGYEKWESSRSLEFEDGKEKLDWNKVPKKYEKLFSTTTTPANRPAKTLKPSRGRKPTPVPSTTDIVNRIVTEWQGDLYKVKENIKHQKLEFAIMKTKLDTTVRAMMTMVVNMCILKIKQGFPKLKKMVGQEKKNYYYVPRGKGKFSARKLATGFAQFMTTHSVKQMNFARLEPLVDILLKHIIDPERYPLIYPNNSDFIIFDSDDSGDEHQKPEEEPEGRSEMTRTSSHFSK